MTLGDLVPWGRKDRSLALREGDTDATSMNELSPFVRLHNEMNRLFDDVFRSFDAPVWGRQWPAVEVQELDDGYRVTAELPGLDERDVDVSLADGVLTILGEKRTEAQSRDRTVSERFYGRFERRIPLGDIEEEKVSATFEKGLLTVVLPKSAAAQERVRRIPINGGTRH